MKINCLVSDGFRVLSYFCSVRGEDGIARITLQEVADDVGISRSTLHYVMKDLRANEYIIPSKNHNGRYIVTDNAVLVVNTLRNLEKLQKAKGGA